MNKTAALGHALRGAGYLTGRERFGHACSNLQLADDVGLDCRDCRTSNAGDGGSGCRLGSGGFFHKQCLELATD
jgi:hypothetical protein